MSLSLCANCMCVWGLVLLYSRGLQWEPVLVGTDIFAKIKKCLSEVHCITSLITNLEETLQVQR